MSHNPRSKGPCSASQPSHALGELEAEHQTIDALEAASADADLEPRGDALDHPTAGAV
jgi:hypothetical protein